MGTRLQVPLDDDVRDALEHLAADEQIPLGRAAARAIPRGLLSAATHEPAAGRRPRWLDLFGANPR